VIFSGRKPALSGENLSEESKQSNLCLKSDMLLVQALKASSLVLKQRPKAAKKSREWHE